MPKIAAFPKAWLDPLCKTGEMKLVEWIELAATLEVDGLEFYSGFLDLQTDGAAKHYRTIAESYGLPIPMLCCSPDFTHPDLSFRAEQIEIETDFIKLSAELGCEYCRILSGQRRPEVSREEGIRYTVDAIEQCLPVAEAVGVTLIMENHYKDGYWTYPEFAQASDLFVEIIEQIDSPHFGVNYDPSNAILAGEDPLAVLELVKHRVVTMHASDRYLKEGTIEDLRREETTEGYAKRLSHGEIGQGMNDFDAIFSTLKEVGFDGWVSIEDGENGVHELSRSVQFLRTKIAEHWP
ncbi:sugar phosphate isomerase/epimerase family protein [Stratiformator vulcanicus]|uniref:Inosose dehydratase n=1 Tax=Stratiformator vulcanicus TaxID=2527980 RepID=A0A517R4T5_9PLAN|nr:Inosose dehydratase [Stratiformator vulcanicus]